MLKGRKGVWFMTFSDVAILLTLLGGAIFVTFQITWTIAHENHDDKNARKMTASQFPNLVGHFLLTNLVRS